MSQRQGHTLTDLLERLPGRPWWWGAGAGVTLVIAGPRRPSRLRPAVAGVGLPTGDDFSDAIATADEASGRTRTEQPRGPHQAPLP